MKIIKNLLSSYYFIKNLRHKTYVLLPIRFIKNLNYKNIILFPMRLVKNLVCKVFSCLVYNFVLSCLIINCILIVSIASYYLYNDYDRVNSCFLIVPALKEKIERFIP